MNRNLIVANLETLTRPELSAIAKRIDCPVGKSRLNTINNIADRMVAVKGVRCTVEFTIRKGESASVDSTVLFSHKLRSARAGTPGTSAILA